MKQPIVRRKRFVLLTPVRDFMREKPGEVKQELNKIICKLESEGVLSMPYAEKISGENLFAIRVIQTANIRIFYVYGINDLIFGIHGYVKKTEKIPESEFQKAEKMVKLLRQGGAVK